MYKSIIVVCASVLVLGCVAADSTVDIESRINNGFDTNVVNVPYIVSIRMTKLETTGTIGHNCAGVIIGNRTVVTAAHCLVNTLQAVISTSDITIVAGQSLLSTAEATSRELRVSQIILHPNFYINRTEYDNDIAIIKTSEDFRFDVMTIQPIAIATLASAEDPSCMVSGWGQYDTQTTASSDRLQSALVPLHSLATCNTGSMLNGILKAGMLCAGDISSPKPTCARDDGGPLECNKLLVGIVSRRSACTTLSATPGIYTDVAYYAEWIRANSAMSVMLSRVLLIAAVVLVSCKSWLF